MSSKVQVARAHLPVTDEDLNLEGHDQENDEGPLVELSLLQDGLPALLEVLQIEHACEEAPALPGLEFVIWRDKGQDY